MHDPAADYCQLDDSTVGRLDRVHGEIGSFSNFEGADLALPAEGTGAFYCKRAQRRIALQACRFGLGPQVQLADTDQRELQSQLRR